MSSYYTDSGILEIDVLGSDESVNLPGCLDGSISHAIAAAVKGAPVSATPAK
jgi:hypothetical protein